MLLMVKARTNVLTMYTSIELSLVSELKFSFKSIKVDYERANKFLYTPVAVDIC